MNLLRKLTFPRQPIQNVLFVGFGGLNVLAVAFVLYLGLTSTTDLTKDYHRVLFETALKNLNNEVEGLLLPAENQALWARDQVELGHLDLNNFQQLETFIRATLGATPNVTGAGFVYPDGTARYINRNNNKFQQTKDITTDEAKRLFASLENVHKPVWGRLFWFEEEHQTVVDVRMPIYVKGKFEAVLFIGVTVAQLSRSILNTSKDEYLTPFILYGDDHVLAHPLLSDGLTIADELGTRADWVEGKGVVPLLSLEGFVDSKLVRLIEGPVQKARLVSPIKGVELNGAIIDSDMHIVATQNLHRFGEKSWMLGVYINGEKSEQTAALRLFQVAGAGVIVLVISVLLSLKVGKKIARPIVRLAEMAKAIRQGVATPVDPLPRSRLRELDQAAQAFNEMMEGLRERDMIREVFGRYVPESVAASLLQDGGQLPAVSGTATILFSDLEGFTRLTEDVGPERIVSILNAYFSDVVDVLERHSGVVTQFQGDAVLATFNVPIQSDDHADKALCAALEIQELLENKTYDGVKLCSRIGINTGNVVAGAVGAEGRLNYTVHGDAVNLAARIESLNKQYKTKVLVSEQTQKRVTICGFEEIGRVEVRGRESDVRLFVLKS